MSGGRVCCRRLHSGAELLRNVIGPLISTDQRRSLLSGWRTAVACKVFRADLDSGFVFAESRLREQERHRSDYRWQSARCQCPYEILPEAGGCYVMDRGHVDFVAASQLSRCGNQGRFIDGKCLDLGASRRRILRILSVRLFENAHATGASAIRLRQ